MTDSFSRRDWIKTVGVAGAGAFVPLDGLTVGAASPTLASSPLPVRTIYAPGDIVELYSTSDVFTPARGRSFQKFSFDFPEPGVVFGDHRFSFLIFTEENTYSLDRSRMVARVDGDSLQLTADGFIWAGGQERAPGTLTVTFEKKGSTIEWEILVAMDRPIRTVTTVIRDVPRGNVAFGGAAPAEPQNPNASRDGDSLAAYAFGGGDLNGPPQSMSTPIAVLQAGDQDFVYITTLDAKVRPKRYYFQAGEKSYRVEAIYEHDAWRNDQRISVPRWRLGRTTSFEAAMQPHMEHIETAFDLQPWETRPDVQPWQRDLALVTTLHGQHYTGFIFNTYAQQLEILRWMATQIPANRVLVFLPAWDGRYYWDYPTYKVPARMGGDAGFRQLIAEGQKMGFKMMPMYGANSANKKLADYWKIAPSITKKIDGNDLNLDWVDWNNDRHQDGWQAYMNLGAEGWRNHLEGRIADMIERFGVDAYFLDIVGGHVNSTTGDMHEGTKKLVMNLRSKYPKVACVGEMPYDALHGFIPMYQVGLGARWGKYSRSYSHLSAPALGRGSSGVHESGFGRFNSETLGLNPNSIPTLQVVDDTFTKYRDVMASVIAKAKARAGIA
jgi:hypothetical protein